VRYAEEVFCPCPDGRADAVQPLLYLLPQDVLCGGRLNQAWDLFLWGDHYYPQVAAIGRCNKTAPVRRGGLLIFKQIL